MQNEQRLEPAQKGDQSIKNQTVISTFKPFKLAGTDEIVLALSQHGIQHSVSHQYFIFRAYMAYGYIPKAWRQLKVMFITKPRHVRGKGLRNNALH
jgi:hypothetical protein